MNRIYIFNCSNKVPDNAIKDALAEIDKLNPLEGILAENCGEIISECVKNSLNKQRNQVDFYKFLFPFLNALNQKGMDSQAKKLVFFDEDLYTENAGWVFGGYQALPLSPGIIIMSSHRIIDSLQRKDIICHELGHMFNAPKDGRQNTYELYGLHCSNNLCVMKQNMSIKEAVKYSHKRRARNADMFCDECREDIKNYAYKLQDAL